MAAKKERAEIDLIINGQSANANLRDLEAAARKAKAELRGMMPGSEEFEKAAKNFSRIESELQKTKEAAGLTKTAFKGIEDSLEHLEFKAQEAQKQLKTLNPNDPKLHQAKLSYQLLTQEIENQREALGLANQKVIHAANSINALEEEAKQAKQALLSMSKFDPKFREKANDVAKLENELEKLKVQAGLTQSKWAKLKQEIKTTFIGNLGANLATLGLQKVAGYFTDAWDNAKKLSDQMADIAKTTGLSVDEVKALNTELGKIDTRTSMSDLREIAKVGGQFGVAKEELLGFVAAVDRTTIALGDEFGGGAEQVAAEMSKLRNVLVDIKSNDIGTDIGFISNAINELAAAGVATGPVVSDLANRIGGYGAQIGLSSGQILGLSATLQELGVSSERGGTAVVKILQKMLTNSQEFATIAGMELGSFEKLLNEDLFGAFTKVMEGSKKMGGSSTLLANIIKDLEVQGAGASEVFAKLGGNSELLAEKVNLASGALTNTNSITEEARLKNENFAGSVERLSKSWSKFTSNPAIVNFFKGLVDLITSTVDGMSSFARIVAYNYDVITKGKAEADRIYLAENEKILQEQLANENKSMKDRIAGAKNGYKQMTASQLQEVVRTNEVMYKADLEHAKKLMAEGKNAEAQKAIERAKETSLELKASKEVLAIKQRTGQQSLDKKREFTEKELKAQEQASKTAEKIAIEQAANELKAFQEKMYAQIDALKELAQMEEEMNGDDSIDAEIERLEKLAKLNKETADDIADYNKEKLAQSAQNMQEIGYSMLDTFGSINSLMAARDQKELDQFSKRQDAKMQKLEENRDKGLITEEQYQAQKAALEEQVLAKEKEVLLKQAKAQKAMAIFDSAMKASLAWVNAALKGFNPVSVAAAIAATVQAGVIAAMPIPEFEQGGFTGGGLNQQYNGKKIAGVVHPNEFVINSSQLKNPFVYNFAQQLNKDKSGQSIGGNSNSTGMDAPVVVKSDPELLQLLMELKNNGVKGVWDWDYEQRTKERMAELDNRRKL